MLSANVNSIDNLRGLSIFYTVRLFYENFLKQSEDEINPLTYYLIIYNKQNC